MGPDYRVSYGYERGRINLVGWQIGAHSGNAGYVYENGLISRSEIQGGPVASYARDPAERYLTAVKNENGGVIISQYDYSYDSLGRRAGIAYSEAAFSDGPFHRRFSYNARGGLTESSAYEGMDINDTGAPIPWDHRYYQYDPMGNRKTAEGWNYETGSPRTESYTSNNLNQYAAITINGKTGYLEYDDDGNLLKTGTGALLMAYDCESRLSSVEYEHVRGDVNGDGASGIADAVAALQVAAGMESQAVMMGADIDADGRIGLEEAIWALRAACGPDNAKIKRKLVFAYDYMGRRIKKATYDYVNGAWEPFGECLFVYDGWNVIEEITVKAGSRKSAYMAWGLDLSQSLHGAGGIGGLILRVDGSGAFYYLYDANGNVSQLVDAANGAISARYEYDPFGNTVFAAGAYAYENPFRFSTKYFDWETGLYYYGKRHYSPCLGRWLTRDPIEERGGINLYVFAQNNPVLFFDPTGKEYSAANAPAPYDIDYGGPGSWAPPRMPGWPGPPSPVVPYIDAGGRAIAGAALLIIPEGVNKQSRRHYADSRQH